MYSLRLDEKQLSLVWAAVRQLKYLVDDSRLNKQSSDDHTPTPDVTSIATAHGRRPFPTVDELGWLESKIAMTTADTAHQGLWAVIALQGGLLESLHVSSNSRVSEKKYIETCRSLGVSEGDPHNEDTEVHHVKLVAEENGYFCP